MDRVICESITIEQFSNILNVGKQYWLKIWEGNEFNTYYICDIISQDTILVLNKKQYNSMFIKVSEYREQRIKDILNG